MSSDDVTFHKNRQKYPDLPILLLFPLFLANFSQTFGISAFFCSVAGRRSRKVRPEKGAERKSPQILRFFDLNLLLSALGNPKNLRITQKESSVSPDRSWRLACDTGSLRQGATLFNRTLKST